jgi:TFIIF-interacting CTD phosphatase-like protein
LEEEIDDFVKDLNRLNRDLKKLIYVDSKPLAFWLHPNNGLLLLITERVVG